jgi:chemotaxis-related protein WspB
MQFLIFHLGKDRYGLHTQRIVRILPLVELKALPQTPAYVAGLLNFHGRPVPVIDVRRLACGSASESWYSTRIVLVDYRVDSGEHLLGLMLERVAGIEQIDTGALSSPGVAMPEAGYLGEVSAHDGSMTQLIEVDRLLTDAVRALLFQREAGAGA